MQPRVAVIGAGISGLSVAWTLARQARITLFEAGAHFGGHAHTVDVCLDGVVHGVDTGFLVYNERTYPNLTRLFAELGVATVDSDMSFSVQVPQRDFEWSGASLSALFAQRGNMLRPAFWHMLADIGRFNRLTTRIARAGEEAAMRQSIGEFLAEHRFSPAFRDGYFLPMIGSIWSCPTVQMLRFPVGTMIRFCHNHGLIQLADRPQWRTVRGGSRNYVQRMLRAVSDTRLRTPVRRVRRVPPGDAATGIWVDTDRGGERFDDVVLACHSDQALALLSAPTAEERRVLGAIRYQRNRAVLHTDSSLLPRRARAWAAWNYERAPSSEREDANVCLHYLINRLQPLPWQTPVIVSLNPVREPQPQRVIGEFDYEHPVFDAPAVAAQRELASIQGRAHVWFCGAWTRYGFHEDGLDSGLAVAAALQQRWLAQAAAVDRPEAA
jgi:predicted NAD/FAD-binding protein